VDQGRRARLASHLQGRGVELGPGHVPFEQPPGVKAVAYVDRWRPEQNRSLFPELATARFPQPDLIADFDLDRLSSLPDASQDFVICSHVLEHLAEPIGFLAEIHRLLRPSGTALIMLPDRRRTFDQHQDATPLAHLVAEYEAGVTRVDDDHIKTFLAKSGPGAMYLDRHDYDWHRLRSIHVHYWTDEEFLPVILYTIERLRLGWTLVDRLRTEEGSDEFGMVLRRSRRRSPRRFRRAWDAAP
jgi:SAM-dependent methyltransferase